MEKETFHEAVTKSLQRIADGIEKLAAGNDNKSKNTTLIVNPAEGTTIITGDVSPCIPPSLSALSALASQAVSCECISKVTADVKKRETARPQREEKPFESLITQLAQKDAVMAMFHRVMPGKRGKAAALVMVCARQLGHIADLPSFAMAVRAFGDIGCRTNFEKFLRFDFRDDEKEPILKALTL